MSQLILLIVAAAWAAVLLPPLVRARIRNTPGTSVSQFRRQLHTLQRGGRPQPAPLRSMARPFAPATQALRRPLHHMGNQVSHATTAFARPVAARRHARFEGPSFERELVRRRRQSWVVGLFGAAVLSLFLALTTRTMFFAWTFTVATIALIGYCYVLVQLRARRDAARRQHQFRRVA
jgi:hypothetical protein